MKSQSLLVLLSASAAIAQQAIYEQCGGQIWTGGTTCASGTTCQVQNPYYSQCLPGSSGGQQQQGGGQPSVVASSASSAETGLPVQAASSAAVAASSAPPSSGGGSGTVNTGSCGAYSGDKTGYATTTHYYDGTEGACGCGQGSMAPWQTGDGSTIFTAAGSQNLFGGSSSWCGSGCGACYELTNVGYIAAAGQGDCTGAGDTITVMITNLCPADGNAQWCSQPTDQYGFGAHFDILSQGAPKGWNNPVVSYKSVACPGSLASDFASCQCASGATSRARRGLVGTDNFYPVF